MISISSRSFVFSALLIGLLPSTFAQPAAESPPTSKPEKRTPTTDEVTGAIADEITERFQGDRAKFLHFLREQGKTVRDYHRETASRLAQTSKASPQGVEAKDEQVHVRLIQLNRREAETDDQLVGRGNDVLAKLKAGEAFSELAKQLSDDVKRSKGGDWGWMKRSDFKKDFEEVAFGLRKGGVSQPIIKPEGCFILFVEDRR